LVFDLLLMNSFFESSLSSNKVLDK
jgi:hypothetical protein